MGGQIDVHSTINEGTRFDIRFPRKSSKTSKAGDLSAETSTN